MLIQSIEKIEKKGIKKGIKKGFEKGIEQGLEQGIEKGLHSKQVEVAKKMLKKKYPVEEIAEITGFSVQEIKSLTDK